METQSNRRDAAESIVDKIQRGEISIFVALAEELPDVFAAEILPKLDAWTTLNLAQVSKSYRDAVWSVDGVRSMEAKIKAYVQNIERREMFTEPMIWAAKYGNLPAVRALLKAGEGINKSLNPHNWTVLRVATFYSQVALVKELIKAGADVNLQATDVTGPIILNYTALHLAATNCHTTIIMELIKGGADVNIASSDGTTPLHIATEEGHEAGVVALMYAGADINAVNRTGMTPLCVAMHFKKKKHERIVELLKHAGAVETRSPGL
jgi:ankyrin repeat protein